MTFSLNKITLNESLCAWPTCMQLKQVNKPRKEPDKVTDRFDVEISCYIGMKYLVIFVSLAATGCQLQRSH